MDFKQLQHLFQKNVNERVETLSRHIAGGGAESYEDYLGQVGRCTGLKEAQDVLDDIVDEWIKQKGEDD